MYADNFSIVINDIKGEFSAFAKACSGKILNMRSGYASIINTFKMQKKRLNEYQSPEEYFDENFRLSKIKLMIIANLEKDKSARLEALIDQFLETVYLQLGVLKSNVNTWFRTNDLTFYKIYQLFLNYISQDIKAIYSDIIQSVLINFKIYLDKSSSNNSFLKNEYDIADIINTRVLVFDYGILDKSRIDDKVSLSLNQLDAKIITDYYSYSNKNKKLHTVSVNEEFQMTSQFLKHMYAESFSLRRAQNQINILLGNSLSALKEDKDSAIILDNINIWVLGKLTKSNIEYLTEEFSLEQFEDQMNELNQNNSLDRTFLIINKLYRNATSAMIKAFVPNSVIKNKIFKVVDSYKDEGV